MGVRARTSSGLRTNWTPQMDRYFIDLMLEQVRTGSRIDDHLFSKRAWKHMTGLFNAKFGFQYEKNVLKNRHKTLRNLYKAIRNLLEQNGFSWDETRQMVTADNQIWDDYIKAHPDARSYRIKIVPYYRDLCEIYRNATVDGRDNQFSHDTNIDDNASGMKIGGELECLESQAMPITYSDLVDNVLESSSNSGGDIDISDQQNKQLVLTPSTTQPSSTGEEIVDFLPEIATAVTSVANKEQHNNSNSTDNVIDALQAVPHISDTSISNRSRAYWQPPMDRYFIDLMLDQVHKGNQIDGLFRKQAWMDMIVMFNAKFGFKYEVDVLKNRYKTLRRQYTVIKNILDQSGFVWDDTRQMVTADDYIWQDYIKAHPDARQYMTRPVPYYNDLCMICRDVIVDGGNSCFGHDVEQHMEVPKVKICGVSRIQSPVASVTQEGRVDYVQESSQLGGAIDISDQKNKRRYEAASMSQHSQKRNSDEGMVNALREMATAVTSLAEKKKESDNSSSFSIENVIDAVQAVPEIDEDLLLDACDFLEDETKAKTFLALDVKLRKKWLMRKLRPPQS